ncbi:hypothetical protein ONZ45_g5868 [Pleurotus djamor]|nr:hypothetical protein ONZ45_g5868 [Pleurotus djamor]
MSLDDAKSPQSSRPYDTPSPRHQQQPEAGPSHLPIENRKRDPATHGANEHYGSNSSPKHRDQYTQPSSSNYASQPPLKRRKFDEESLSRLSSDMNPSPLGSQEPQRNSKIKVEERSPSPNLHSQNLQRDQKQDPIIKREPRSPSPHHDCRKPNPLYKANRAKWARSEMTKLEEKGVRPTKWLTREDGMVIEWTCRYPVWSDTLEPDTGPLVPSSSQISLTDPGDERSEIPGRSTAPPSRTDPANSPEHLISVVPVVDGTENATEASLSSTPDCRTLADIGVSEEDSEMEELSLKFLERVSYMQMFNVNRADLLEAYHPDAYFSFRVHATSGDQLAQPLPRNIFQGRERIGRALRLLTAYKVCQEENAIVYDLLPTNDSCFLTCYGAALNTNATPPSNVYFGQSLILRRNDDGGDDGFRTKRWPLVAVSHQITIGDFPVNISSPSVS